MLDELEFEIEPAAHLRLVRCAAVPRPSATRCTRVTPGAPARICWHARRLRPGSISPRATHERLSRRLPAGRARCVAGWRGHLRVRRRSPSWCTSTTRSAASPATNHQDLLGKNLRMLQGEDRDQQELDSLREALRHNEAGARAGAQSAQGRHGVRQRHADLPVAQRRGQGHAPHRLPPGRWDARAHRRHRHPRPSSRVGEDRLTGLASRYYFEDVLKRDFALAQRDKTDIALLLFDIDQLGPYNEIFDRAGGDAVVKRVARAIAGSFRAAPTSSAAGKARA